MKSIALWYVKRKKGTTPNKEAELHINWGKLPKTPLQTVSSGCSWDRHYPFRRVPGFTRFVDFGLLIKDYKNIKSIKFYFPFSFEESDFQDLGDIIKDVNILSALFNERFTISHTTNGNLHHASQLNDKSDKNNRSFSVYSLKSEFKIEKPKDGEGTILTLSIPKYLNNQPKQLYIRFRLKGKPLRKFCYSEPLSFTLIQSSFNRASMIDFRMNDLREIDPKIIEHTIVPENFFSFTKVHFFFIGTSRDENVFFNRMSDNCRLLEMNRWSKYLEGLSFNKKRKVLAYHWKSNESLKDINLLLKTNSTFIRIPDLLLYLIVLIFIGLFVNVISSIFIPRYIDPYFGIKDKEPITSCECNK
nr:hypothetical protein [Parabacteroides goldsteinii]